MKGLKHPAIIAGLKHTQRRQLGRQPFTLGWAAAGAHGHKIKRPFCAAVSRISLAIAYHSRPTMNPAPTTDCYFRWQAVAAAGERRLFGVAGAVFWKLCAHLRSAQTTMQTSKMVAYIEPIRARW